MIKIKAILTVLVVNLIYLFLILICVATIDNKINLTKDALVLTKIAILLICAIIDFASYFFSYDYFEKCNRKKESVLLVKKHLSQTKYTEVIPLRNIGIYFDTKFYAILSKLDGNVEIYKKIKNKMILEKKISYEDFIDFYKIK